MGTSMVPATDAPAVNPAGLIPTPMTVDKDIFVSVLSVQSIVSGRKQRRPSQERSQGKTHSAYGTDGTATV